jgi:hypothetical protein
MVEEREDRSEMFLYSDFPARVQMNKGSSPEGFFKISCGIFFAAETVPEEKK